MPRSLAASATACAWFPALAATTPVEGGSVAITFIAPRNLKEPVRWRFSHFSSTGEPVRSPRSVLGTTGVSRTRPAMRSRAARMSSIVTAGAGASDAAMHTILPQRGRRRHPLPVSTKMAL